MLNKLNKSRIRIYKKHKFNLSLFSVNREIRISVLATVYKITPVNVDCEIQKDHSCERNRLP